MSAPSAIRNPQSETAPPPLRAFTSALPAADAPIMYVPGGDHLACMGYGEGAAEVALRVSPETAQVLQASLEAALKAHAPQRPFLDKNHEVVEATGWPVAFFWSDAPQPGVYVRAELSALGQQLIDGKVMRAFSPSFHSDADLPSRPIKGKVITIPAGKRGSKENPARMTRIHFPDCGTLTNDPAFRKILPLWAKHAAGAPSSETKPAPVGAAHPNEHMTPDEKAALQARKTTLEQELPSLRAKAEADPGEHKPTLDASVAELETVNLKLDAEALRAKTVALEDVVSAQRQKDAADAVKAAVKRGAIPAKDDALQAKWQQRCFEDPENLELLASMKGSPALEGPRRLILNNVQITQEDIRTVLKAYGDEPDPLKRGALYARNISRRLEDVMDLPLKATDTYYGDLVVQRTLELLKFEFPLLSRVTTDFSQENASYGQAIKTRIVTPPSVVAYHTTNGYVPQTTTTADVSVTISNHSSVPIKFDANVLGSTMRRLFDEQLPAMQYSLGKAMVDALYALIVTGTYTNTPITEAQLDFDRSTVIAMGSALTAQGVPQTGRTLLLNSNYYGTLMEDTVIANLGANQRAEIITGNRLPQVHGFEVLEAANLPSTGNLTGFAFSKSALALATRVPTDVSNAFPGVTGGAVTRIITNPDTGMSVLMIQHVAPILGHAYLVLAWMYGVAAGQVAAGQILRSA